jgi:DNA polymerase-3 subunit beta
MATATRERKTSGITLATSTLRATLADVLKAVPTRHAKPILANVRLGDGLLTGTDLEVRIDREIDYHGDAILLPAYRLNAILDVAVGSEVSLIPNGGLVVVKCGSGEWKLPTEDASEYPSWEPNELKSICRLPADQFRRASRATTYATDSESSRYALGGVMLEVLPTDDGSEQHWVATDGRRLAHVRTENDQAVDESKTLIPFRVMKFASDMASGSNAMQVDANSKEVQLSCDGLTITGRIVEGAFPPSWKELVKINDDDGEPSVIDAIELMQSVKSAAIVASEQSKGIRLSWMKHMLHINGRSSEYGESEAKCPIIAAGSTASTKLDPRYVIDFLDPKHLPADEEPHVDVYVKDAQSRVLLRCGPYTGVIMPLAEDA